MSTDESSDRILPYWADPEVPEQSLDAQGVSRRGLLRGAGLFGAGFLATSALGAGTASAAEDDSDGVDTLSAEERHRPSPPDNGRSGRYAYLVGDHHIHSIYSHDAKYRLLQQTNHAAQYGLDWMVATEHSNFGHANAAGASRENQEIKAVRAANPRLLVFQGLEWYIPSAEHATVFTAPGPHEVDLLTRFELAHDSKLNKLDDPTAANEQRAIAAIKWLAEQRRNGTAPDVLALANHPSRLGIDSPHEIRAWRDAAPEIFIGMEGAPGSQGAAIPGWGGPNGIRGEYQNSPSDRSWPGFPLEAYRTYGGFDWMTATVGGLWDSMLAEGKPFWVTSNSDNHRTVFDTWHDGDYPPGTDFDSLGRKPDPYDSGTPQPGSDFWPGQFSRTHVGVTRFGYREVMAGLRAGRVWVDHGQLIDGIEVRLRRDDFDPCGVTLGERLRVRRGHRVTLEVRITPSTRRNAHGMLPKLATLDVIKGAVTGPVADRDTWRAPDTKVVQHFDVSDRRGTFTLRIPLGRVDRSFYVRLRGSDGNHNGPGLLGAAVDPHGPQTHTPGSGDPWIDLWAYTNPIFVDAV
ncbi:histidinol-phosphatase [Solihabitans fulvus]|uniref:Histidinol-phosphatase n=1 Tax=Solihabitans fulvus TaxID=1892852 RepID=A0A5B2X5K8_9PSEU|nr:histidinol-phosphatase [Solihabitans fulvus]KAA2258524.1 histidinol-phosphatase [Solihabitans fulvus]